MYLPSYCSFRMTDIWRSYVAQRIAWECGWSVLYHEPTVWQERNEHNLMKDFEDEIPGYTNNLNICKTLQALHLKPGDRISYEIQGDTVVIRHQPGAMAVFGALKPRPEQAGVEFPEARRKAREEWEDDSAREGLR